MQKPPGLLTIGRHRYYTPVADVTDSGIPAPQYVPPTSEEDQIPSNFHILKGVAPRKSNEPSQDEIDATARLNQLQYEEYRRQMRGK
jgi:hypothetical protein